MSKINFIIVPAIIFLTCISCVSGKKITYYQNMESLEQEIVEARKGLEIKPNDLLIITVSGENPEAVQPFNIPVVSIPSTGDVASVMGQQRLQTYLVDNDGNIEFPRLGTIEVAGLSRSKLGQLLEEKISKYVQNPIVNIRIANFQVTVLGEVTMPGTFNVPDENLSLNKALGLAGDLTIYGKRENVLIIRETEQGKTYSYVDLTDSKLLNSPFYYLQQNDVVYVEPNSAQKQASSYNPNASLYISIASVLISLIIVFIR